MSLVMVGTLTIGRAPSSTGEEILLIERFDFFKLPWEPSRIFQWQYTTLSYERTIKLDLVDSLLHGYVQSTS